MDGQRFDNLTRLLAKGTSRRQVLRGLAGGTLGGAFVALGFGGPGVRAVAAAQGCTLGDDSTCGNDNLKCCAMPNLPGHTMCLPKAADCPGQQSQQSCVNDGDACTDASECCTQGATCTGSVCTPPTPPACTLGDNSTCGSGEECCPVHNQAGATTCIATGTQCAQQACANDGNACVYASECCTQGATCTGSVCTPPAQQSCTLGDNTTCGQGEECCPVHNQPGQTTCIPTGTNCAQQACAADGNPCVYASECCTDGATCTGNVCTLQAHLCVQPGGDCNTTQDCCVGQCGSAGGCNCGHPDAPWQDCPCDPTTANSCGSGFVCCAGGNNNRGGTCEPEAQGCPPQCKAFGQTCSGNADCCSGKCSDQGVCYCTDPDRPGVGCACSTGTPNACGDDTLVCCATTNTPGGPGVCAPTSTGCQGQCKNPGEQCGGGGDCCSGKCSDQGVCYCTDPTQPGVGCACTTGTETACGGDTSLVCCANTPGAPAGSPGTCTPSGVGCQQPTCKDAGDTCTQDSDCCQGTCDPQQKICYCTEPDRPFIGCTCKSGDANGCSGRPDLCCNGTCISPMATCAPPCQGAGDTCKQDSDCCQGKCSDKGVCYCKDPDRPAVGCTCTTGTENPCGDTSLLCCATTSQPGGPGICTPSGVGCQPHACKSADDHCHHAGDCCSGKCSKQGACYCTDPTQPALGCACTTGTLNPCGDANLICCSTSNVPGGPGVCTSASTGCQPVTSLPNTGSGPGGGRTSDWETTAAVVGAGAAALLGWWRRTTGRAAEAKATEDSGIE